MTEKQIIYAEIPEYDQGTQYVTQGEAVETENSIYYPCVIHNMPPQDNNFDEGM